MVNRAEASNLSDEFEGIVESVTLEEGVDERKQYHIAIKPTTFEVKSPTGLMHEWVGMSPKATEDSVLPGSVMDRYLTQVEICISAAKKAPTVNAALNLMVGKKFRFKKLKLGRDYEGHSAKDYLVPVVAL